MRILWIVILIGFSSMGCKSASSYSGERSQAEQSRLSQAGAPGPMTASRVAAQSPLQTERQTAVDPGRSLDRVLSNQSTQVDQALMLQGDPTASSGGETPAIFESQGR